MNYQNNLTLILLVHDNTKFPERWIEYANFIKLPYKIYIGENTNSKIIIRAEYLNGFLRALETFSQLIKNGDKRLITGEKR